MRRPNVILIHGHDLGRFLSCYDQVGVPSPHIDAFAAQSVVFDNAFATAPLCTPARGSLFTGQSPHVNGLMGLAHQGWRYRRSISTLPELLAAQGYDTSLVGLQHEHPDPTVLGFDEVRGQGFLPRALPVADEAARWLKEREVKSSPFFLTIGMWEAHRPWPSEDYSFPDPDSFDVPPFLPDNAHTREDLAAFYGAIRQLDLAVGRTLEAVDQCTDPDDTMVIFTTDHGAAFPRAKGTLYDPGVGVAFIVRPPARWGVSPGRRSQLVSHLDVLPTLLELAGSAADERHEGRSLVPDLRGAAIDTDRSLYFEKTFHDTYDPIRAIRTGRYKLVRNFVDGPRLVLSRDLKDSPTWRGMKHPGHRQPRPVFELYDLQADPWEQRNLAADPDSAHIKAHLEAELAEWMKQTRDPLLDRTVDAPPPASRLTDAQPDLPS